ncbi:MAG: cell division protein FtsK, partial [Alphaproteobacteria bacterium]|nr:cell division protein FtsK [Alphaproteobacteria bacterium]
TQRPSVNVITGVIKANFPPRISFQVSSKIDSRTILERQGAEQLLDHGDMLYMAAGRNPVRVHAPFATEREAQAVAKFLRGQGKPNYVHEVGQEETGQKKSVLDQALGGNQEAKDEELYGQAVQVVVQYNRASTSFVQRQLRIGYNRAATLVELMEERGVISAPNAQGKREVLVKNG